MAEVIWDKLRPGASMETAVLMVTRIRDNFWPHMRVLRKADGSVVVTIYPRSRERD
jgi:hypothetical protein